MVASSLYQDVLTAVLKAGGEGIIIATYTNNNLEITEACKGITCVLVDFDIGYQIEMYIDSERQVFMSDFRKID